MEFSRQEYWSGLPFPSPGDLPNTGMEPGSPALWADALLSESPGSPKKCQSHQHQTAKQSFSPGLGTATIYRIAKGTDS